MKIKKINFRPNFNSEDVDVLLESKLVGMLIYNNILETYTFYATNALFEYFSEENHFKSPQEFEQNFENNFPRFIERLQNKVNEVYEDEIVVYDKLKLLFMGIDGHIVFSKSCDNFTNHHQDCTVVKNHSTNKVTVNFGNYVSFLCSKFGFTKDEEYVDKLVYKKYFEIRWLNKISNGIIPIFYFIYGDDFIKEIGKQVSYNIFDLDKITIL